MSHSGGAPDASAPTLVERLLGFVFLVVGLVLVALAVAIEKLAELLDLNRADREPPWTMKDPDW